MVEEANPLESLKAGYWGRITTDNPCLRVGCVIRQLGSRGRLMRVTQVMMEFNLARRNKRPTPSKHMAPGHSNSRKGCGQEEKKCYLKFQPSKMTLQLNTMEEII